MTVMVAAAPPAAAAPADPPAVLLEGIDRSGELSEAVKNRVMGELRQHFRPEFLNRVDDMVLFKPLTLQEVEQIVGLLVTEKEGRLFVVTDYVPPDERQRVSLQDTSPLPGIVDCQC